jgi:hypothetical protein
MRETGDMQRQAKYEEKRKESELNGIASGIEGIG